jgi:hydrogenase maturation protein HypF
MLNKLILCLGADIKNRFIFAKGKDFYSGPDIGDLSDAHNFTEFKKEISVKIKKLGKPKVIACDLHPSYNSVRFARENDRLFVRGYKLIQVQHHHAHIASVLQENRMKKAVIGVSFDGTGYGADGNIWGGEFLLVNRYKFRRLAHFKYRMMPGADKVIYEPWRMVLSILGEKGAHFIKGIDKKSKDIILLMMSKNINSPLTSSAGRLFDAAAALLGVCIRASYEAEGPMKLEAMCDRRIEEAYDFKTVKSKGCYTIDTDDIFLGILKDLRKGRSKHSIAAKFHNSIIEIIVSTVKKLSKDFNLKDVALGGGVFQNKFIKIKVIEKLTKNNFNIFTNKISPVNDYNIAWGQYYVSCCACKN